MELIYFSIIMLCQLLLCPAHYTFTSQENDKRHRTDSISRVRIELDPIAKTNNVFLKLCIVWKHSQLQIYVLIGFKRRIFEMLFRAFSHETQLCHKLDKYFMCVKVLTLSTRHRRRTLLWSFRINCETHREIHNRTRMWWIIQYICLHFSHTDQRSNPNWMVPHSRHASTCSPMVICKDRRDQLTL